MTNRHISLMAERRYETIAISQITVINSRLRDEEQFDMNVHSIEQTGLMMPIRVNDKFLQKTGMYELVCGEGRLIAHQRLGRPHIDAEIVTCSRKDAYLESLIENIARTTPGTMYFAREVKRLKDEGWEFPEIARICCRSPEYVKQYIRLVEQGEERLIKGVEQGIFSISFALLVAFTDNANIQHVLMDAFDQGIISASNFAQAKRVIGARLERRRDDRRRVATQPLTVSMLQKDIMDATREKDSFVREAKTKENRFLGLLVGINAVWQDDELRAILNRENLLQRPELAGEFSYDS